MCPYRCVKCGQSHKTSQCPKKDRNTPATCALYNGPHAATYKCCDVYREILNKRLRHQKPLLKEQFRTEKPKTYEVPPTNIDTTRRIKSTTESDADICETNKTQTDGTYEHIQEHNVTPNIEEILRRQNDKFEQILQQMSTLMELIVRLVDRLRK